MIDNQLRQSTTLKFVILLIDFKVGPTELDLEMFNYLQSLNLIVLVVATKVDKIPKTKRYKQQKEILNKLHNHEYFYAVSNTEKIGIDQVITFIIERINL